MKNQPAGQTVIFGVSDTAELAHYYLCRDTKTSVAAFTVDRKYLQNDTFCGLPVVPFEDLIEIRPPAEYQLFAPMTATRMNQDRERVFNTGKDMGYSFFSYVSPRATVYDNEIGENCFILEDNTIQPFTKIGNNVVLWSGNHIGHHGHIGDHVFFTSQVVMSGHCQIGSNCFVGVNASIRDYSILGKGTLLGMGACFTGKETEDWSVYVGNPAVRRKGLVSHKIM
ncbi:MAG: acetyltransferase [Granulosicoccus sp.]|nr:acetyltransferase [Granulosicoccus sp.]